MSNVIDFSEVKGLEPVPDGMYDFEIVKAEVGESSSNNPKIDLRFKIVGGEYDGRNIFDTISFHPNALWRAKKVLESLDVDVEGSINLDELPLVLVDVTGSMEVSIESSTAINPSTGETYPDRNRIQNIAELY